MPTTESKARTRIFLGIAAVCLLAVWAFHPGLVADGVLRILSLLDLAWDGLAAGLRYASATH
jgi:hypothetical protein